MQRYEISLPIRYDILVNYLMGSQYTDGINTNGINIKNRLLRKQLRNYFHIKYYGIIFSK